MLDIGVYALSFVRWFMSSCPAEILSQVKFAATGVDEQAGILLKNKEEEMATVLLSLHAKQPKRGTISFDRAYIELFEYPRGDKAIITWTGDGRREEISRVMQVTHWSMRFVTWSRLLWGDPAVMHLDYTVDVMRMMTAIRQQWHMKYPEEEQ